MNNLSWQFDDARNLLEVIDDNTGNRIMCISISEMITCLGRKHTMRHVRICDKTPWLKQWQEEYGDMVLDKLAGK